MLQVRLTTAQKVVVRHLKCHGLGPQIANRLVTGLYQHLMGLPLLGVYVCGKRQGAWAHSPETRQAACPKVQNWRDRDLEILPVGVLGGSVCFFARFSGRRILNFRSLCFQRFESLHGQYAFSSHPLSIISELWGYFVILV